MKWDEKETYQFVKCYLSKHCLWNPTSIENKSLHERKKAIQMIIEEFMSSTGILLNADEVRMKIKNLRSTYSQEINKIRKRSGPQYRYTPNIKWFADWHRCIQSYSQKHADIVYDDHKSESETTWVTNNSDQINEEVKTDPFDDAQNFDSESDSNKHITTLNHRVMSKKKRKKIKSSYNSDASDTSLTRDDEFDLYGRYIASQLRQLNIQKALQLQLSIQSLMSEARIADLVSEM